jgi:hypothetical protein
MFTHAFRACIGRAGITIRATFKLGRHASPLVASRSNGTRITVIAGALVVRVRANTVGTRIVRARTAIVTGLIRVRVSATLRGAYIQRAEKTIVAQRFDGQVRYLVEFLIACVLRAIHSIIGLGRFTGHAAKKTIAALGSVAEKSIVAIGIVGRI